MMSLFYEDRPQTSHPIEVVSLFSFFGQVYIVAFKTSEFKQGMSLLQQAGQLACDPGGRMV